MKKIVIISLGIALLLPAFAYASSYCVEFPTGGNSKWSKRDNQVGVRFKYNYEVVNEKGTLKGAYTVSGNLKGENLPTEYDIDYVWYDYGTRELCLDTSSLATDLQWFVDNATKDTDGISFPDDSVATVTGVSLDIKYGGDCSKANVTGDHKFRIHRRKGDHINPWGCKWK